jgi:ketol-acid reductoisomerase
MVECKATRPRSAGHLIKEIGEKLHAMMPWIAQNQLVD